MAFAHSRCASARPQIRVWPRRISLCISKCILRHISARSRAQGAGAKTIVFSTYTKFLDLLGTALDDHGVAYARVDGSQTMGHRDKQARVPRRVP